MESNGYNIMRSVRIGRSPLTTVKLGNIHQKHQKAGKTLGKALQRK